MSYSTTLDSNMIQQWIVSKKQPEVIEQDLTVKGLDSESIKAYLKEFKRLKNFKKQCSGFFCAGLGAVLGFISCLLTIINPVPALYEAILFGLTSIAILVICYGLYLIFE